MYFLNVNLRAPSILSRLREIAAKDRKDWRAVYAEGWRKPLHLASPYNPATSAYGENHCRWIEDTDAAGLRSVGFADQILELRHTGWFTNEFQDETNRGVVFQLPSRNGRERFVYGYADPNNKGAAFLSFDPCDDKRDAARWADRMAERAAEEEREYQAKESANLRIDEIEREQATIRQDLLALIKEAKAICPMLVNAESVKDAIRTRIRDYLTEREELREERDKLKDNPWTVYPEYR